MVCQTERTDTVKIRISELCDLIEGLCVDVDSSYPLSVSGQFLNLDGDDAEDEAEQDRQLLQKVLQHEVDAIGVHHRTLRRLEIKYVTVSCMHHTLLWMAHPHTCACAPTLLRCVDSIQEGGAGVREAVSSRASEEAGGQDHRTLGPLVDIDARATGLLWPAPGPRTQNARIRMPILSLPSPN